MNSYFARNGFLGLVLASGLIAAMRPEAVAQDAAAIKLERDGLKLEMAALAPDQVRAFFLARGFKPADTDFIVERGCVFRSSIGSSFTKPGSPEVTVTLSDWRVTPNAGVSARPMTREDWEAVWKKRGAGEDAAVAFYWALFPSSQSFAPTDYNWGMLTFAMPPGTAFSLELHWRSGTEKHVAKLEKLQCGK